MALGISPEDLNRIFNPYFTGERGRQYHESTGMGLYLVREICSRLGHNTSQIETDELTFVMEGRYEKNIVEFKGLNKVYPGKRTYEISGGQRHEQRLPGQLLLRLRLFWLMSLQVHLTPILFLFRLHLSSWCYQRRARYEFSRRNEDCFLYCVCFCFLFHPILN